MTTEEQRQYITRLRMVLEILRPVGIEKLRSYRQLIADKARSYDAVAPLAINYNPKRGEMIRAEVAGIDGVIALIEAAETITRLKEEMTTEEAMRAQIDAIFE